jgi:hypothetical protein
MNELIETRMPSFEGGQAGTVATLKLPIGLRYHSLSLEYSSITLAEMTEIRLKANGKVFQKYSATDLDVLNQQKGLAAAAGLLFIPFDRIGLLNRADRERTAINTGVADANGNAINSFTMEIDIAGGVSGTPVLRVDATQSAPVAGGPGVIINIRPETRTISGAGELEVSDYQYNTPTAQAITAMHLKPSAGSISKVKIERNLRPIWERKAALNTRVQSNGIRVPQAGWFHVDTAEKAYAGNTISLGGAQDFRVIMDCGEAMQVKSLIEYIGVLGN